MVAQVRIHVRIEKDSFADFNQRVLAALPHASVEGARAIDRRAVERVEQDNVPGPPLEPQTIAKEAAVLRKRGESTRNARLKWRWLGRMTESEVIFTTVGKRSSTSTIHGAPSTSRATYQLLEFGGINEEDRVIPPRPLWTTILKAERGLWVGKALRGFRRAMRWF